MRAVALAALLAFAACPLVGCHRPQADQPTPGADEQTKTAAKTVADLKAADDAAHGPAPDIPPAEAPRVEKPKPEPESAASNDSDDDTVETNAQD